MRPLDGKRVLITRAHKQAASLREALEALGATVIEVPAIEIRPPDSYAALDDALGRLQEYDWLLLTSVNGVEALLARMETLGLPVEALEHMHLAAIGPATARALEQQALKVEVVPRRYVAEEVVRALTPRVIGKRVLLARAAVARDVIPVELGRLGARVDVVDAYRTILPDGSQEELHATLSDPARQPDVVTFTSSSTANNFFSMLEGAGRASLPPRVVLASIGPITSNTLRSLGLQPHVEAEEYTVAGLAQAISEHFRRP